MKIIELLVIALVSTGTLQLGSQCRQIIQEAYFDLSLLKNAK